MSTIVGFAVPALLAALVWWASTGAIFFLNGRGRETYRWSVLSAAAVAIVAGYELMATRQNPGAADAAIAFVAAIAIWGLAEITFLMGFITGPRRSLCPPDVKGFERFWLAFMAIAYHEVFLAAMLALIVWSTAGSANFVGAATFALLWLMRLSAKLNIFFGVPNTSAELLPADMLYLGTYFRHAPMTIFFPLSVTLITILSGTLLAYAAMATQSGFELAAYSLISALAVLGLIEHWFLVLPISPQALWGWSLTNTDAAQKNDHDSTASKRILRQPLGLVDTPQ